LRCGDLVANAGDQPSGSLGLGLGISVIAAAVAALPSII
jgi:hypothetical protein